MHNLQLVSKILQKYVFIFFKSSSLTKKTTLLLKLHSENNKDFW